MSSPSDWAEEGWGRQLPNKETRAQTAGVLAAMEDEKYHILLLMQAAA